ncbi:MAG: aldehyde dehydrogenase (NADP(+)) [Pseudomonas sp.]
MTTALHGKHLIAGDWVSTNDQFQNEPTRGPADSFSTGTAELINHACESAEEAFWSYGYSTQEERAQFLNTIADEIEVRADAITAIGTRETGLPEARLIGERGRTVGQLRLFAQYISSGDYLDCRRDSALPDRKPMPRPDLRSMQRPIGPVAVFGASNFPLAFSVAGGDTVSALAAGCTVVVKGHPAHPGTSEVVAEAIHWAIKKCGMASGVFSLIQGGAHEVGAALVKHPLIKAVGFTGSLTAGRALFDLCARRPEPIPFFGELGSINPMFVLPGALEKRGANLANGWAGSLTMGAGQFCTNPGIAILMDGPLTESFAVHTATALKQVQPQTMLTAAIAESFRRGKKQVEADTAVRPLFTTDSVGRQVSPSLYEVDASAFLGNTNLGEEVFGPLGLVVRVSSVTEMLSLAQSLGGQLTATLHMEPSDLELAKKLMIILERKAGRLLVNGFPTGVEVADTMVHGGPYPASTNFGATSVGTMAIRRFLRPVSYQNIPADLLPAELR